METRCRARQLVCYQLAGVSVNLAGERARVIGDYDEVHALWAHTEHVGAGASDSRENIRKYLKRNPGLSLVGPPSSRTAGLRRASAGPRQAGRHGAGMTDGAALSIIMRSMRAPGDATK